jgi:3-carboxy-cis,cis-muconate cycloisomerase
VLEHYNTALSAILSALGTLAETHADLPVAARTYGQYATPTSFGAQAAAWGWPLLALRDELEALKPAVLWVSLAGAAGTASEMGENAADLRAALAAALGLNDPGRNWHNDRAPITRLAAWCARVSAALGKMGEDLILATQSGSAEVQLGASGGSSTMPQKQNPVGPSALVALGRHAQGLNTTLQGAAVHRQNRDGAAWFTEWLTLPQLCQSVAVSLHHAQVLAEGLRPMPQAMAEPLSGGQGLIYAEALSFALTDRMSRPDAQAEVKTMCKAVIADGGTLPEAALAKWPDLAPSLFDPAARMGQAPAEARKFASLVKG